MILLTENNVRIKDTTKVFPINPREGEGDHEAELRTESEAKDYATEKRSCVFKVFCDPNIKGKRSKPYLYGFGVPK